MRRVVLLLLLSLAAAPAAAQEPCPFPGQSPQLLVRMFFGQGSGGGDPISHRAWERFVADTVTPALPGGFTIIDAAGQWRDPRTGAIARERTEELVVAAPDGPALRDRIAAISAAFRRRFAQRMVGLVTDTVCAAF